MKSSPERSFVNEFGPANTFVDYDLALKKAVNRLREVPRRLRRESALYRNHPRRGYRFVHGGSGR